MLARVLENNASLLYLTISNSVNFGDAGALAIGAALERNDTLRGLKICFEQVRDEGVRAIAKALKTNSALERLSISFNPIGDEGTANIARCLHENSTLRELDLRCNLIQLKGAEALASLLQVNSTLTTLRLDSNVMGDQACSAIMRALHQNRALRRLFLCENDAGQNCAKICGSVLRNNLSLVRIDLSDNPIEDSGVKEIAQSLETNSTLQRLHLSSMEITEDGLRAVARALKKNSALKRLDLSMDAPDSGNIIADALKNNFTLHSMDFDGHVNFQIATVQPAIDLIMRNRRFEVLCTAKNLFERTKDVAIGMRALQLPIYTILDIVEWEFALLMLEIEIESTGLRCSTVDDCFTYLSLGQRSKRITMVESIRKFNAARTPNKKRK